MLLIISEYKIKFAATCRPCNDMVHELWVRLMGRYLPVEVKHLESPSVVGDPIWTRGREAVSPYGNGLKKWSALYQNSRKEPRISTCILFGLRNNKSNINDPTYFCLSVPLFMFMYLSGFCLSICSSACFVCLSGCLSESRPTYVVRAWQFHWQHQLIYGPSGWWPLKGYRQ